MNLIRNSGNDRVVDELRRCLVPQSRLDIASPEFSLFAFAEVRELLEKTERCRLILPTGEELEQGLLGSDADRPFRNRLLSRWLARQCRDWLEKNAEVRGAPKKLPQSIFISDGPDQALRRAIAGHCPFTTEGLGLTPGNHLSLVQSS